MKKMFYLLAGLVLLFGAHGSVSLAAGIALTPASFSFPILKGAQKELSITLFNEDPSKPAFFNVESKGNSDLKEGTDIFFPKSFRIPAGKDSGVFLIKIDTSHLMADKTYKTALSFFPDDLKQDVSDGIKYRYAGEVPITLDVVSTPTPEMLAITFDEKNMSDLAVSSFFRSPDEQKNVQTYVQLTNRSEHYFKNITVFYSVVRLGERKSSTSQQLLGVHGILKPHETKKVLVTSFPKQTGIYLAHFTNPAGLKTDQIVIHPFSAWVQYFWSQTYTKVFLALFLLYVYLMCVWLYKKRTVPMLQIVRRLFPLYALILIPGIFFHFQTFLFPHISSHSDSVDYVVSTHDDQTIIMEPVTKSRLELNGAWKIFEVNSNASTKHLFLFPVSTETQKKYNQQFYFMSRQGIVAHVLAGLPETIRNVRLNKDGKFALVEGESKEHVSSVCLVNFLEETSPCVPLQEMDKNPIQDAFFSKEDSSLLYLQETNARVTYSLWLHTIVKKEAIQESEHVVSQKETAETKEEKDMLKEKEIPFWNMVRQPNGWLMVDPRLTYVSLNDKTVLQYKKTKRRTDVALIRLSDADTVLLPSLAADSKIYFLEDGSFMTTP